MSFGFARRASDCRWIPTASTPASTIRSATSPACAAGEPTSGVEERSPVEVPVVIRHLLMIHDRSSFEGWTLGGSRCQPDVRKRFLTVLPFGCILAGPCPAEERHRETPFEEREPKAAENS